LLTSLRLKVRPCPAEEWKISDLTSSSSNSSANVQRTPGEIRGCVVLATCLKVLEADPDSGSEIDKDVDGDMQITLDALHEVGIDARPVAWDDSTFDWSSCDAVIVRSTWDYHRHIDGFLRWLDDVSQVTRLENPVDVLRWNIDKRYLAELGASGLPVIETLFVEPETVSWTEFVDAMAARGDVVVKPAVSAGSNDTQRHGHVASARAHIDELLARGRVVMVQPYLDRVDAESETGLVYIDGVFSHAFSKGPMLAAPGNAVGDLYLEEKIDARTPTATQRELGDRVMALLLERWGRLLYARVDMLPTDNGPVIIEVELTEPSLYLHLDDGAPASFASAIASRLA
jgi:glutathione synthase/RimK-type ligase-like ATP-grasp enzyme